MIVMPMLCVFSCSLWNSISCSLKAPNGFTRKTCTPLSTIFLRWFSDLLFNMERALKSSELGSETTTNHENQQANLHRNAPTTTSCKKAPTGRSQTSEIDNPQNTFSCFPKRPKLSKRRQQGSDMEDSGSPNHEKVGQTSTPQNIRERDHQKLVRVSILVPIKE